MTYHLPLLTTISPKIKAYVQLHRMSLTSNVNSAIAKKLYLLNIFMFNFPLVSCYFLPTQVVAV